MKGIILASLTIAMTIAYVSGHAMLIQPVSRASGFRVYPDKFPVVQQDDADMCNNPNINNSCGICGPIYYNDVTARYFLISFIQNFQN